MLRVMDGSLNPSAVLGEFGLSTEVLSDTVRSGETSVKELYFL
jgi:hypothetical protein